MQQGIDRIEHKQRMESYRSWVDDPINARVFSEKPFR
jgi:hypothetical protein